ncbi:MAG: aminoacetone oxidase family FAD-binding enzyme [Armatimonadetes bacterium]|nr:aminoacetone oxidase family FAD-binding enzyme [Armatimonadota bacterium]
MKPEVVVIGGGAAGIIAARRAAERGARVTLLEKNERLGLKILISGGGKCNLTHAGGMEDIRAKFRPNEARFLKPAFYKFSNADFLDILHARGMATYTRPDGRIFPTEPADAKAVVALLTRYVEEAGVRIKYGAAVTGLVAEDGVMAGVYFSGSPSIGGGGAFLSASRVIVATGGSSYPATGTTGDGWEWLTALGHTLVPLRAALAPLYLADALPDHSGVALRDVVLRARVGPGGKEMTRWRGDLLLTHKGVSGPTALGIARDVADHHAEARAWAVLEADLVPDQSFEAVQADLRREVRDNPRKTAASLVAPYVPARLVETLLVAAGVDGVTRGAHLPAKSLNKLVATLKGWPLGDVRHIPLERGEVVAGGVSLDEVDPQTMRSRLVGGLFLCGEILDIAGPIGGYNLQAAWSTGWVAGESAGG